MKAGVIALAVGSASAGIYGYEAESSSTPVVSTSAAWEDPKEYTAPASSSGSWEDPKEYTWAASSTAPASSSGSWEDPKKYTWAASSSASASSSSGAWGYPEHHPKGSWGASSSEAASSTSAGWAVDGWAKLGWGGKPTVATTEAGAWPTPAYFDPSKAWGCCKTVVTVTVTPWETSKTPDVTSTSVVWVVPSPAVSSSEKWEKPEKPATTSTSEKWEKPEKPATTSTSEKWEKPEKPATTSTSEEWAKPSSVEKVKSSSAAVWDPPAGKWTSTAEAWTKETTEATWAKESTSTEATWAKETTEATWTGKSYETATEDSWGSSSTSGASTGEHGFVTKGGKWAMTYTPYTTGGECKTAEEVNIDVADIASLGFTTIRIYATDCSALVNVGSACKANGLKIILGVFIDNKGISGASSQVDDITAWGNSGYWDTVGLIVVGNEAIFNGFCSASDLAGFITSSKKTWAAAGYKGPVSTTEPVNIIEEWASTLCAVVDVATSNVQPYFTSSVEASWAGDFVNTQLALVSAACGGKTAYALEAGWPSSGNNNGAAIASPEAQKTAIADILAKAGDKVALFSYQDDAWKAPGSFGVEQYFGCATSI